MPVTDGVLLKELFDCQTPYLRALFDAHTYPWELLTALDGYLAALLSDGIEGFTRLASGILVGRDVRIAEGATVLPPTVLGEGCEVRPGAYVRGGVITGRGCVIGNSSELKHSVLLDGVQIPHYNYVGDSILGNRAHMGAGAVCSNLKADGGAVTVHGAKDYPTGRRKLGGILADGADVGCGCVLNPGTVLGRRTSVYPLTALRGVYPADCIVKDASTVVPRR